MARIFLSVIVLRGGRDASGARYCLSDREHMSGYSRLGDE